MYWYEGEEAFLSVYMAEKLANGGEPFVTSQELQRALADFKSSWRYREQYDKYTNNFDFEDLEALADKFQTAARESRSWLNPCFVCQNGRLYATYSFYDFVNKYQAELKNFFMGYEFPKTSRPHDKLVGVSEENKKLARLAALYITKAFATKYIAKEVEDGRWPKHLDEISYIFSKDLGRVLELPGTKDYFVKFYGTTYENLAEMIQQNNGKLSLSSTRGGDLEFNNFARATGGIHLDCVWPSTSEYDKDTYRISIKDGEVVANATRLEFSDPYGEWSDTYSTTATKLNDNNTKLA